MRENIFILLPILEVGFPDGTNGKNLPSNAGEKTGPSLGWENSLEEGMTTHSSILAWRNAWTEEPASLQSMGSQRVKYD